MFLIYIVALLVIVVAFALLVPLRRHYPGPPSVGLLGSYILLFRNLNRRHRLIRELHAKYGPYVEMSRFRVKAILVYRPEDVKFVMTEKDIFQDRPNNAFRGIYVYVLARSE